uniref:Uncharacterized protein n=1 Tax=Peronospora matthiolae TaxID=2874970 RepID=A0AAV1UCP6_9STRA
MKCSLKDVWYLAAADNELLRADKSPGRGGMAQAKRNLARNDLLNMETYSSMAQAKRNLARNDLLDMEILGRGPVLFQMCCTCLVVQWEGRVLGSSKGCEFEFSRNDQSASDNSAGKKLKWIGPSSALLPESRSL